MSDRDERNGRHGRDLLTVVVPVEPRRPKPVEVHAASAFARNAASELQRTTYDAVLAMVASVNWTAEQTGDNTAQLIVLSKAFNELAANLRETRARADSSAEIAEVAGRVEEAVDRLEELKEASSPGFVVAQPHDSERIRRIAQEQDDIAEIRRKAKAYDDVAHTRRKVFIAAAGAVLAAIVLAALAVSWRLASEHAAGVAEGEAHRVVTVPSPVLMPSAAPEPAPEAPASVAPRGRK